MKKIGVWNFHIPYKMQPHFCLNGMYHHRNDDGAAYAFSVLSSFLRSKGIEWVPLSYEDDFSSYDEFFFIDYPYPTKHHELIDRALRSSKKKYLFLIENEVVKSNNWNPVNHDKFNVIFTWNDDFVDNKKYFKIFPTPRDREIWKIPEITAVRSGNLCMIIGNKRFKVHPNSLFDYRRSIIKWHVKNEHHKLDLYGRGWDHAQPFPINSSFGFRLNKIVKFFNFPNPFKKLWLGDIEFKRDILINYNFTYAIENARNYKGYILEKILDPILSGSVPIYYGASNIDAYIPQEVFIDLSKFSSLIELNNFLKDLNTKQILEYRQAGKEFVLSENFYPFTVNSFVENVTKAIYE